ncbi:hypothetical protein KLP40_19140 [Hymenobacter sp. NST-14]|uniref:hypothetical protein n=1 Tax=Hymenobacter piscis TaxID=2839984 RepID=UPI001C02BE2A|nr:hypothetical protein [Hymenobacter piscis]MBT9395290.1 hypothetical protein [Hymenobacter piscis]
MTDDWQSITDLLLSTGKSTSVLLLGIIWGRKINFGFIFRPLLTYLVCDAALYILDAIARKIFHNNIFNFHLSTFLDVTWLTLIFIHLASEKAKKLLKISWLMFFFSAVASALWIDGLTANMNTLSRMVGNSFLVFMAFRQLTQMVHREHLLPPAESPAFILCIAVAIYYSSSLLVFIGQDLPRYGWLSGSENNFSEQYIVRTLLEFYPFLRAIQFGLLLHLITLFPMGITPRHALPRWLRFRVGWRPPTKTWHYRVLPPHLVG